MPCDFQIAGKICGKRGMLSDSDFYLRSVIRICAQKIFAVVIAFPVMKIARWQRTPTAAARLWAAE
ncbi:MAG: hypothetical protein ONB47_14290 [candidate division KSB1 bacterium]|nr:hypothetical protein [candidate division KSB1 bacterium]